MSLEFLASYSDAMAHFFHLLEQQFPQKVDFRFKSRRMNLFIKVLSSDFGEELSDRNQFPEPIIDSLVEEQAKVVLTLLLHLLRIYIVDLNMVHLRGSNCM